MLENAYFYLSLSFAAFLYIYANKIHPLIFNQLNLYREKIERSLEDLEHQQSLLLETLIKTKKDSELVPEHIHNIHKKGQDMAEKLKESYNQTMVKFMIERQDMANRNMMKLQNRFESDFYTAITKEMQDLLVDWGRENINNLNFQNNAFENSFNLLQDSLNK
ncbi:MAG: hypothetical protein HEEMFOPI_00365 [Holosporales bacterium]